MAAKSIVSKLRPKNLAVIGNAITIASFLKEILSIKKVGYAINAVCIVDGGRNNPEIEAGVNTYSTIESLLKESEFDALTFETSRWMFTDNDVRRILDMQNKGVELYDLPSFYKNLTGKVPLAYIDGKWLLASGIHREGIGDFYLRIKRILDTILALFFLVLASPVMVGVALAIKLDTRGGALFVQERLGEDKKPFKLYKFRTMVQDAEAKDGPQWATEKDPRITRIGGFLRKSRLDELPQLWNVFKGDMSFVGPRPIRQHFAEQLEKIIPFYDLRFGVKPGLTGWAQVNHTYAGSDEEQMEKFQYELFYLQNMSLLLDLYIIVKTVRTVLFGSGAR